MRKKYHAVAAVLAAAMLVTACGSSAGAGNTANKNDTSVAKEANQENGKTGTSNANQEDDKTVTNNANQEDDITVTNNANTENDTSVINDAAAVQSELFSKRDLSGEYDKAKCGNITLSDGGCTADLKSVTIGKNGNADTVTITGEGDYMVSGSLNDGMLIVDVDKTEKVQLILNGVEIKSASSAAIYVKSADKVFVTLADGTKNTLTNGGSFVAVDDNNIDAVIFSKDDLTINGTGTLIVNSPAGHGIVSKDELTVAGGNYEITASLHGMTGKDSVAIADGTFRITAGEDAIKSDNNDDVTKGSVYIFGGSYVLNAGSDGINALNEINISGGKIAVEKSDEGFEARVVNISGGDTDITSSDDGINATDKRTAAAAAEGTAGTTAAGGGMNATDQKNALPATGNDTRVGKGFGGGGMDEAGINISGGIVRVDAEGDGLDSNGHLAVSGGEIYIAGSLNNGDSALDYDIDAVISGGIVVAAGQGGMAQNFGSESTQGTILLSIGQTNAAGSEIALLDSAGRKLVSWIAEKSYNSVVISCPEIKDGETYTVRTGETDTSVTMDGLIYGQGGTFGGHGGGMRGFKDGTRPERKTEGMPLPPDGAKSKDKPEQL